MKKRNILCLSTSNYDAVPTRKQNIMNRMTDADVLYIDPPVTYIAPLKDPQAKKRFFEHSSGGRMVKEHVTVYAQRPVIPLYNKFRQVNRLNQAGLAVYLAQLVCEHGFGSDFWLWCYSPTSADVVEPLAKMLGIEAASLWNRTVYDCVDRHAAYPGLINPAVVDDMEKDLAMNAAVVFTTAEGLYDTLSAYNERTYLIPNGVDYELFSKVASIVPKPDRPITLGFVGMLQECIDYALIKATACSFPDGRIVLVGNALPGVDLSWLSDYPNITHIGRVPQAQLPEIMADFHVCLNVFAGTELAKHVSPLKFYEYLATGKPIVSTPFPLQVNEYRDYIYIGGTAEAFVEKCREAAREPADDPKSKSRMLAAKHSSWDERLAQMRKQLGW